MSCRLGKWLLALLPAFAGAAACAATPAPLTFCVEDVVQRPWTSPAGVGLNFELLKMVEKRLGEHFNYVFRPWKRCLEEVRLGRLDGIVGAADSPERRTFAVFPLLADGRVDPSRELFQERYHVFLRAGGKASWDGHQLRTPGNTVLVQAGYVIASVARERGLQPNELVKSSEEGLRMVADGIAEAAILYGDESERLAYEDPRFAGRVVGAPQPYWVTHLFLMVGRRSEARDPQRIAAIWRAIGAVRQTQEYQKIEASSLFSPP